VTNSITSSDEKGRKGHRDLIAWQKAMDLVTDIYRITKDFPREEMFGLTRQIRRAAVSVPSNLAEGHGRTSRKEFHPFVANARGSLVEVETQIEIAQRLGYLSQKESVRVLGLANEVGRIVNGLLSWSK
jgi:four helix bundle protein